jgi:hypothetical protein
MLAATAFSGRRDFTHFDGSGCAGLLRSAGAGQRAAPRVSAVDHRPTDHRQHCLAGHQRRDQPGDGGQEPGVDGGRVTEYTPHRGHRLAERRPRRGRHRPLAASAALRRCSAGGRSGVAGTAGPHHPRVGLAGPQRAAQGRPGALPPVRSSCHSVVAPRGSGRPRVADLGDTAAPAPNVPGRALYGGGAGRGPPRRRRSIRPLAQPGPILRGGSDGLIRCSADRRGRCRRIGPAHPPAAGLAGSQRAIKSAL